MRECFAACCLLALCACGSLTGCRMLMPATEPGKKEQAFDPASTKSDAPASPPPAGDAPAPAREAKSSTASAEPPPAPEPIRPAATGEGGNAPAVHTTEKTDKPAPLPAPLPSPEDATPRPPGPLAQKPPLPLQGPPGAAAGTMLVGAVGAPNPHQRPTPTAMGSVLQLGTHATPIEAALDLNVKVEALRQENSVIKERICALEESIHTRDRLIGAAARDIQDATAEVARVRRDLQSWAEELKGQQTRLRQLDREHQELLQGVIRMLEKAVGPEGVPSSKPASTP